jgi:hypothetical protein
MNDELERKWKTTVVAYLRLKSLDSPRETEESQKTLESQPRHFPSTSPARGSVVVKALCYKPESLGFDTQ